VEGGGGVADRREDDRERGQELPARPAADEKRHTAETDDEAGEARTADALVVAETQGEQCREERRRRLDDRGQPGVEPCLRPGDREGRERRTEQRGGGQRAGRPARLAQRRACV